MKNYKYLILIILLLFFRNVNANVDSTNAFWFTYDCVDWVGTLHTQFSLGGHHIYNRDYNINKPWIIDISDSNHTTVSKASNISIGWCWYTPTDCSITNWWNRSSEGEINKKKIEIITDLEIYKEDNNILINWSWSESTIKIKWFQDDYLSTWKNIKIEFLNASIKLYENSSLKKQINFTNNIYNDIKEYYYEFNSWNNIINLILRKFKREWSWIVSTSNNTYDIYSAVSWNNYCPSYNDCAMSSNNDYKNKYYTGLNYWDYTQHHYTTTKVKLYPVNMTCNKNEYNFKNSDITISSFVWTLWWITEPIFWWDIKINNNTKDDFGSIVIYSTGSLNISWLKYITVWKVGWINMWVNKINISIKENDITLWSIDNTITPTNTVGNFQDFSNLIFYDSSWKTISTISWNYQIVFSFFNDSQILWTYELPLSIIPNNNFKSYWGPIIYWNDNDYANNSDSLKLCQKITDEYENEINYSDSLNLPSDNVNITDWIILDKVNNTWKALVKSDIIFNNSSICFNLKSLSPDKKKIKFTLKVPKNSEEIPLSQNWDFKNIEIESSSDIEFRKPFIWELKASKDWWSTWNDLPDTGTNIDYKLEVINKDSVLNNIPSTIANFKDYIKVTDNNTVLQNLSDIDALSTKNPKFNARINTSESASSLWVPWIKIENWWKSSVYISYNLWGKNIKYYLSASVDDYDNNNIIELKNETENNFIWVKVIWNIQWDWKSEFTWQEANFSDLSKSDLRQQIRSNAYRYISQMSSWDIVWWVKYIEWDINIFWNNLWYETLVVKDWNVIINWNLTQSKLWIIVLKDNYNVNSDYSTKWNIYIKPDVTKINAVIYADWWVISSNASWNAYTADSDSRTSDLQKQLTINWSLFTRNTIGWVILAWGKYILPWWSKITDFDKAMIYDLNYLRRWNDWCDTDWDGNCITNDATILKYNPSVQNNPPKLFGN